MAEQSGFFDAHLVDGTYDRVYLAESFAKYFASFIGNGVFGGKSNELMVQQKTTADMSVRVLSGQGWINGYWYENTSELSLAIDVADGILNRIDLIVLRWDNIERDIHLVVKKGTPAATAAAPLIQRDADYYELKLAEIYIKAGATNIKQADITDTRLDENVCGLVASVVKNFDTTDFYQQMNSFLEELKKESTATIEGMIADLQSLIDDDAVANLASDVAALKEIAIESEDYRGCYYRVFEGVVEWLNPPAMYGVEYRTTERWQNKPVYQKTFYAASLPNSSIMGIAVDANFTAIVSIGGFALDTDNNLHYPFPIFNSNSLVPVAVIGDYEGDGGDGGYINIRTSADLTSFQAYITIKYTKT